MGTFVTRLRGLTVAATANAKYKAWKVERDAAATRLRYARSSNGKSFVPGGENFSAALARRLGNRPKRLGWPKRLGDLHVFLIYPLCNWEAVLPEAFAAFGKVSQYEWRSRGFDEGAGDWLDRRDLMNQEMLAAFHATNAASPVDVVVGYVSGYTIAPGILLEMAASGAVITNFCFDDKIYWPGAKRGGRYPTTAALASAVDLNLSCDPEAGAKYYAHGGLCMFHPEAADPEWYRPLNLPFDHDVSFVGAAYGWRPRLIEGLRRRGIDVACYGNGWPNGAIANDGMNGLYARSRINLGCGGIGFSSKLLCLKGRDFEVPMSGAVYLTQDNPELSLVFEVGQEILTYRDIDHCAQIIRATLGDPERATRVRLAARARCLQDHTYRARWTGVLRTLGAIAGDSKG